MAKIAVLGYGVVGSGTVEVIEKNKEGLLKKAGQEIEIKYILDLRDFPTVLIKTSFVKDFSFLRFSCSEAEKCHASRRSFR